VGHVVPGQRLNHRAGAGDLREGIVAKTDPDPVARHPDHVPRADCADANDHTLTSHEAMAHPIAMDFTFLGRQPG
jgi:hypothetical protein